MTQERNIRSITNDTDLGGVRDKVKVHEMYRTKTVIKIINSDVSSRRIEEKERSLSSIIELELRR